MKATKTILLVVTALLAALYLERESNATVYQHPEHECQSKDCRDLICTAGGGTCTHSAAQWQWPKCWDRNDEAFHCAEDTDWGLVECLGKVAGTNTDCTCFYRKCENVPAVQIP